MTQTQTSDATTPRGKFPVAGVAGIIVVGVVLGALALVFGGHKTEAQPAPPVVKARPISDVACGQTYQLDHLESFYVDGRVAVNFYFGGRNRDLQPQYIWAENVLGQPTEIWKARTVLPSLEYSMVTFLCLNDPSLEGHKISNVEVMRYQLILRRPLRQQRVIRNGGPARQ